MKLTSPSPSLFDPKEYNARRAYCALIEPGYYRIGEYRIRVSVDRSVHLVKLWSDRRELWLNFARLYETDKAGIFNYYRIGGSGLPDISEHYYELMAHPAKYRAAYGQDAHRCGDCNRELKHPRSKHYGIGPECETKPENQYLIEIVDEANGGLPWEALQK